MRTLLLSILVLALAACGASATTSTAENTTAPPPPRRAPEPEPEPETPDDVVIDEAQASRESAAAIAAYLGQHPEIDEVRLGAVTLRSFLRLVRIGDTATFCVTYTQGENFCWTEEQPEDAEFFFGGWRTPQRENETDPILTGVVGFAPPGARIARTAYRFPSGERSALSPMAATTSSDVHRPTWFPAPAQRAPREALAPQIRRDVRPGRNAPDEEAPPAPTEEWTAMTRTQADLSVFNGWEASPLESELEAITFHNDWGQFFCIKGENIWRCSAPEALSGDGWRFDRYTGLHPAGSHLLLQRERFSTGSQDYSTPDVRRGDVAIEIFDAENLTRVGSLTYGRTRSTGTLTDENTDEEELHIVAERYVHPWRADGECIRFEAPATEVANVRPNFTTLSRARGRVTTTRAGDTLPLEDGHYATPVEGADDPLFAPVDLRGIWQVTDDGLVKTRRCPAPTE